MKIPAFLSKNGQIGVRNHILVFPTIICAAQVAEAVSRAVPGTVSVNHPHGCGHLGEEREHMVRTMAGYCANPNVGGVLLVGLGCELISPQVIAAELAARRVPYAILSIQACGGSAAAVRRGVELARRLKRQARRAERIEVDLSQLKIGVKCGGSDTFSGLSANPALGAASDRLVAAGGTVIMTEVPEMIGAEEVLSRRAANQRVAARIRQITRRMEQSIMRAGVDVRGTEPSPGNIAGGLTTLEEKSLGAVLKGGSTPIRQVVGYAESPSRTGLVIMDGPALDAVSLTGLLAAGAQIIVFTTGRGTPLGAAIAPVIKVATNSRLFQAMGDDLDLNAGEILDGGMSIDAMGQRIFEKICAVAGGEATRSEILQHHEFAIHNIGPAV